MNKTDFLKHGWCRFDYDPQLMHWVEQVLPHARKSVSDHRNQQWKRCGGTWFAGVNVLENNSDGSIADSDILKGRAINFIRQQLEIKQISWDRAQISVCYEGYPQPMASESEAAFQYRVERDAAHVDGLLAEGAERRRHLRETHGFILGIPLVDFSSAASPFVVWQGSHEIVRERFRQRFGGLRAKYWGAEDLTETYHQLRRDIFTSCKRVEVTAKPGEAFLVHRLILHGIAPWKTGATAGKDGRMICYFRPPTCDASGWLFNP